MPVKTVARRVELKDYTTLRIGGPAELWEVETLAELKEATSAPFRILGAGSNLLVSDRGVRERVVKLGAAFNSIRTFDRDPEQWIGAATPVPGLVRRAQRLGLSGLEGLLGVPAVLGGAIAMNAGTRFGAVSDSLLELELSIGGRIERIEADQVSFGYRWAELPKGGVVTRARLALTPSTPDRVEARLREVDAARAGQPKIKSAGCAFKNPAGDSAGRLIDVAGLKGLRVGDAMVSLEHGNFIVNLGNASAKDICGLLELIQNRLPSPLELEWCLWGF
ncbi:MAG: UDP-N-acetylmuramate dehydrogenase [Trueperaceae bacterium]|nr:MAG: UDP-N-acetylmuramate dehydrogenase [Trueperaceae bacterium]